MARYTITQKHNTKNQYLTKNEKANRRLLRTNAKTINTTFETNSIAQVNTKRISINNRTTLSVIINFYVQALPISVVSLMNVPVGSYLIISSIALSISIAFSSTES